MPLTGGRSWGLGEDGVWTREREAACCGVEPEPRMVWDVRWPDGRAGRAYSYGVRAWQTLAWQVPFPLGVIQHAATVPGAVLCWAAEQETDVPFHACLRRWLSIRGEGVLSGVSPYVPALVTLASGVWELRAEDSFGRGATPHPVRGAGQAAA